MTVKQCYESFGGDYEGTLTRLMTDGLILRFLKKFLNDGSFPLLEDSLSRGDLAEAFRAAHTLKGVCQNLGMDRLYSSSAEITEVLRAGNAPENALFQRVREDYLLTCDAIRRLDESK